MLAKLSSSYLRLIPGPICSQTKAHFIMKSPAFPLDLLLSPDLTGPPSPESKPDNSSPDSPLPPTISQSFIDRILWPSTGISEPRIGSKEQIPHVAFNDDLTTRVCASVEYTFYSAEKVSKTAFAGSVTFYCPVPLGNPVLDSMLQLVADQVNADVLELDALELVAGTLGLDTTPIEVETS